MAPCRLGWRGLVLVIALWLPATLFFGGRLGWWNDDYLFNGRDPATGAVAFWVQTAPSPFDAPAGVQYWRPLNFAFTTGLITLFWERDWVVHVVGAVAHLVAALLLFRVLARFGLSWQACLLGCLVLLCWPAGFECVLWGAAIATGVATSMLLGCVLLYTRLAKGELTRGGYVWFTVLAAAVPLVNEQPAACLAALPCVCFAFRKDGEAWQRTLTRGLVPLVLPLVAHLVYLSVISRNLPAGAYGSAGSLVELRELPRRMLSIGNQMRREMRLINLGWGALSTGAGAMVRAWFVGFLVAGVGAAVWMCGRWWVGGKESGEVSGHVSGLVARRAERARLGWLVVFAVGVMVMALVPLAAVKVIEVRPRMAYVFTAGLAMVLALVGNAARDVVVRKWKPWARAAYGVGTYAAVVSVCAACVVMWVGVQTAARARTAADARSMERLREWIPEVPPGAWFVPLGVDNFAVRSGTARFDWYYASAWFWSYAFPQYARQALRRDDVESGYADGSNRLVVGADADGFEFAGRTRFGAVAEGRRPRIAWDRAILFDVGFGGEVTLRSPVRVERGGMLVGEFVVPLVEEARKRGARVEGWTVVE